MSRVKLQQLKHESDTWKRTLSFMMDENIHLKNRLSEVLKTGSSLQFLADAESFQTNFLRQDDMVRVLRSDIAQFDKLLVRETFDNEMNIGTIEAKLKNIRNNISIAGKKFDTLQLDFNNYLLENIE